MSKKKILIIFLLLLIPYILLVLFIRQEAHNIESDIRLSDYPERHYIEEREEDKAEEKTTTTIERKEEFTKLPHQTTECLYRIKNIPSPKGLAFHPSGEEVWITSLMNKTNGVFIYDVITGEHIEGIQLPGGGGVEVIFNQDGSFAYVSQMETGRVFEIDTTSKEISRTLNTNSAWTKVMTIYEDYLFASNWSGNDISVISLEGGHLIERINTINTPRGIITANNNLYVAGFSNGEIQVINLDSKSKEVVKTTGGAMRHIVATSSKEYLYFSDMGQNEIHRLNTEDNTVDFFAKTEVNPNTISLALDDKVLLVSNRGSNHPSGNYHIKGEEWGSIMIFDTATGELLDVLLGGNQPTALDVHNEKSVFAYSNFLDGEVVVCRLPSYEELKNNEGASDYYHEYLSK